MGHTGPMLRRPVHVTRRRVAAHACPGCRQLWALRGARSELGAWVISCGSCGWSDIRAAAAIRPDGAPGDAAPGCTLGHWSHGVFLYDTDADLLRVLEDYLLNAWATGGVALVVATPQHRAALRDRLAGLGLGAAMGQGRLVELDAATTLAQFMVDGLPDPDLFERTLGGLVRDHAGDAPLHGFGEMVDLLWADGNAVGALALERLWSGLQEVAPFWLLCAYAAEHLDPSDRELVASAHDHVIR